jgi:D-ribose pyranose/furanose isomerase RbsD
VNRENSVIIDLDVCRPEISIEQQIEKIKEEVKEVEKALTAFKVTNCKKDRAEILFELLDVMNAAQTSIFSMFKEDEIEAGCRYINSKNFVRGYLLTEEDE